MNRQSGILLAIGVAVSVGALTAGVAVGGNITDSPNSVTTPMPNGSTGAVDGTTIVITNGTLTLDAASEQVVRGRTDLPAGTTVSIRLQSTSSEMPFIRSSEVSVADNGTFRTAVDLSQITDQPEFRVSVYHDGNKVANTSGQVVGTAEDPVGTSSPEERTDVERLNQTDSEAAPANATFFADDSQLTLPATSDAQLRGQTDLTPGTNVSMRLRSTNAENPFIYSQEATVGENGTIAVTYNMSTVDSRTEFEASIHHDSDELASRSGILVG